MEALDAVAKRRSATAAAVTIAWIGAQPGVGAPIASATSVEQLKSLTDGARLGLSGDDLRELTVAGR